MDVVVVVEQHYYRTQQIDLMKIEPNRQDEMKIKKIAITKRKRLCRGITRYPLDFLDG